MPNDTRARMIDAAVCALQRRGLAGMSFTEILQASGAARGAIYHHFPGGKAELVAEAATRNGQAVRDHLAALPGATPAAIVDNFLAAVRPVVAASATGGGCAVAAITVEPDGDTLRRIADTAFTSWTAALAERLAATGVEPDEAQDLATALIGLLEGAHILCRAAGTLEPFEHAARAVAGLVRSRT
ncbi:TetR/AcrR family transcriptional regulator [Nocardia stercoris]|uniref:TetR/AcrR family transcriptional regulator n=1 Tax=Nocardia stercoris TaxID=2483361 RepID=A0A3M2L314_9NOCA|nr:TetR/AcrR family transcriptional regulator [Nocardia stercoris]RMI28908.1 TetR/AcrR family transcriptional regulator [Nocardia stercoris]